MSAACVANPKERAGALSIHFQFRIAPSGVVDAVSVEPIELGGKLKACLRRGALGIQFPAGTEPSLSMKLSLRERG
ncbi:MAG: hypothetical protein HC923_05360 [Myxococcales bacterium]|nr:hypothetical protein [Myxococcales bacterium]